MPCVFKEKSNFKWGHQEELTKYDAHQLSFEVWKWTSMSRVGTGYGYTDSGLPTMSLHLMQTARTAGAALGTGGHVVLSFIAERPSSSLALSSTSEPLG